MICYVCRGSTLPCEICRTKCKGCTAGCPDCVVNKEGTGHGGRVVLKTTMVEKSKDSISLPSVKS